MQEEVRIQDIKFHPNETLKIHYFENNEGSSGMIQRTFINWIKWNLKEWLLGNFTYIPRTYKLKNLSFEQFLTIGK